jgi:hypothetical protein
VSRDRCVCGNAVSYFGLDVLNLFWQSRQQSEVQIARGLRTLSTVVAILSDVLPLAVFQDGCGNSGVDSGEIRYAMTRAGSGESFRRIGATLNRPAYHVMPREDQVACTKLSFPTFPKETDDRYTTLQTASFLWASRFDTCMWLDLRYEAANSTRSLGD